VLGTKFNVTAYADFKRTETSLIEGKIEIFKGDKVFPAVPGQEITFTDNHFYIINTDTNLSTKWKDDIFDFDKIPFQELIVRLERWYDVEIEIQNTELNDILYSGIFKNEETIWQVLNTFQLTIPIRYSRVGFRKFLIKPN
jgi:ferric-dicitrate binding protein FerR (iron transport regulator)